MTCLPRVPGLIVAAFLASAVSGFAQEVRGRFLTTVDEAPLAGALMTLVDPQGVVRATALSNASGWFSLRAPAPGRYTVRGEHIGYSTQVETVVARTGSVTWTELRAAFQAIELEGLTAEVDRACSLPRATALRLANLWQEVAKALRVTAHVESQGTYLFAVERWHRILDPDRLRVEEEQRSARTGMFAGSPFVSLPPLRLAEEGYVQGEAGDKDIRYYGPDARVLIDPSFAATHCFALIERGPSEGWIGLGFRPQDRRAREIEGTLWIDRATYEPRQLDFRYTSLPWPIITDRIGGRVVFDRLPEGPWIVRRWYLRMPVVGFGRAGVALSGERYALTSVLEVGGEVIEVRSEKSVAFAAHLGSISGAVVASASGLPSVGARVWVLGTDMSDTADVEGRFLIPDVPEGRYGLMATSQGLLELGHEGLLIDIELTAGETKVLTVSLPAPREVVLQRCESAFLEEDEGVLLGRVFGPDHEPFPGGTVQVSWTKAGPVHGSKASVVVTVGQVDRLATVRVGSDGRFAACGLPEDVPIALVAIAPGQKGHVVRARIGRAQVGRVELRLEPASVAESLVVHIKAPDRRTPIEAAHVALPDLGRSAVTDANGTAVFEDVPLGLLAIDVSHLAYLRRSDTLDVRESGRTVVNVAMSDRVLGLEPIIVEVVTPEERVERQRGASSSVSVSQAKIQELVRGGRADNVADVLRASLPTGVKMAPMIHKNMYVGTCIESTRGGAQFRKLHLGENNCAMVQVVLDGGYLTTAEAARLVETLPLFDIVSMEFLSPMDQTFRFGTQQATGMLVIRTSR